MTRSSRHDPNPLIGLGLLLSLLGTLCSGWAWFEHRYPCLEYATRTVERTDCETYGEQFDKQGRAYGGTTTCTTRPVAERYCVRRSE